MCRYSELEWDQNKISHSPGISGIFRDLASPYVKGTSPNCKNLGSRHWMRTLGRSAREELEGTVLHYQGIPGL
jgi:hypothetical protein